jgi:hypothetical protein
VANAEGIDQAFEPHLAPRGNRTEQLAYRHLA